MPPLAYFITWTTYGNWLHGDKRGSADRSGAHQPGRPYLDHNPRRTTFERTEMAAASVALDHKARTVVDLTIRAHIEFRGWYLHALNVRSNHVHLVISAKIPPEDVMGQCKAWSSRRLLEAGLFEKNRKIWTRHGSTRYLNTEASVDGAIRYVRDGQGSNSIDTSHIEESPS